MPSPAPDASPPPLRLNLIGPGRLGRTLARLCAQSARYRIAGIAGRTQLAEAQAFIGEGAVCALEQLPPAELWLIAVPDAAIAEVAEALVARGGIRPGDVVFHCSGAGSAELLAPLRHHGAQIASLHPVFSFADPALAVRSFAGTPCALEGDEPACQTLEAFAQGLGGAPFRLVPGGKAAYHAALCVASNYLVTLSQLALDTAHLAGMDAAQALPLVHRLMAQTLANVARLGPAAALTGPIARNDAATVSAHLHSLARHPELSQLYRELGHATLPLAEQQNPTQDYTELLALLTTPDAKNKG